MATIWVLLLLLVVTKLIELPHLYKQHHHHKQRR
jgi:hypothetical protein